MFKKISLRSCVAIILILVLIPIYVATAYISFNSKKEELNYYEKVAVESSLQGTIAQITATEKVYNFIANRYENELRKEAEKFLAFVESSEEPYTEIDLEKYKKHGSSYFDYYIINKNNVIINTTFAKDLGLDFKDRADFNDALTKIRLSGKNKVSKITMARKTGKPRKWIYIPTKDKEYLLEIGLKSEEVEKYLKPIDFNKINEIIIKENPTIKKTAVYDYYFRDLATKKIVTEAKERAIIKEVFDTKTSKEFYDEDGFLAKKYKLINNSDKVIDDADRIVVAEYDNTIALKLLDELRIQTIVIFCILTLVLLLIVNYFVNKYLVKPIIKLKNGVNKFTEDVFSDNYRNISTDNLGSEEVKSLVDSFNSMASRLNRSLVSKDYLENIIDSVGEIIIITDKDLKIISGNKYVQQTIGMKKEAILEYKLYDFFKEEVALKNYCAKLKGTLAKDLSEELELTLILKNRELPVIAKIVPYSNKNGELEGFICSARDITKLQETVDLIKEKSNNLLKDSLHDPLTKCLNRRGLIAPLEKAFKLAKNETEEFSVIMFDIDDFKVVNDTYGHQEGDGVLVKVAKIMKENCRREDFVVRFGGEEFLLLLPGANVQIGYAIAEKIRLQIAATLFTEFKFRITISGGVAQWNYEDKEIESIIKRADEQLYKSKTNGKNQINF